MNGTWDMACFGTGGMVSELHWAGIKAKGGGKTDGNPSMGTGCRSYIVVGKQ